MAESAMPTKALEIELRAFDDDNGLVSRKLKLTPGSSLSIGRSSRSTSKQLVAAVDNVVLDSPVVSREHARLTTDSDCKTLFIKDLGSMHGTMVNNVQLGRNVTHQLKNGDKLQIGNTVVRGDESFSPPKFDVSFKDTDALPSPRPTPSKFTVPESDSEDDDSYNEESDGEDGDRGSQSSPLEQAIHATFSDPKAESSKRLGSQQNPVKILDDMDVVQDSILIPDGDDEARAAANRSSDAMPAQTEQQATKVTAQHSKLKDAVSNETAPAAKGSSSASATVKKVGGHPTLSPFTKRQLHAVFYGGEDPYDSESGETDFHPEVDQNDLDEEASDTGSDAIGLEGLVPSSPHDAQDAEVNILGRLDDDSIFDTDDEDAVAQIDAALKKADGREVEQMPPRLRIKNVLNSYEDQSFDKFEATCNWTAMQPTSPSLTRGVDQGAVNRPFDMPPRIFSQPSPYSTTSTSRGSGLFPDRAVLHPETFASQGSNTNGGLYQPQPLSGLGTVYNTWDTSNYLSRYGDGPFAIPPAMPPIAEHSSTHTAASPPCPYGIANPSKPNKMKTGFSIHEIVDSASSVDIGPRTGMKRKADEVMEEVSTALAPSNSTTAGAQRPTSPQAEQVESQTEAVARNEGAIFPTVAVPAADAMPSEAAVIQERPAKRSRLGYAATAIAGAVVGGIGMFAALALSPDL